MKTSKMMKTINKAIKEGHTVLLQEDVKKHFGKCNEEIIEKLQDLDCKTEATNGTYTVHLTRTFTEEEIEREMLLEEFTNF